MIVTGESVIQMRAVIAAVCITICFVVSVVVVVVFGSPIVVRVQFLVVVRKGRESV